MPYASGPEPQGSQLIPAIPDQSTDPVPPVRCTVSRFPTRTPATFGGSTLDLLRVSKESKGSNKMRNHSASSATSTQSSDLPTRGRIRTLSPEPIEKLIPDIVANPFSPRREVGRFSTSCASSESYAEMALDGSEPLEGMLRRVVRQELERIVFGEEPGESEDAGRPEGNVHYAAFVIGEHVRMRDSSTDEWQNGKVTNLSPLEVQGNGGKEPRTWAIVEHTCRKSDSNSGMLHGLANAAHAVEAVAEHAVSVAAHDVARAVHRVEEASGHAARALFSGSSQQFGTLANLEDETPREGNKNEPRRTAYSLTSERSWVGWVSQHLNGQSRDLFERMLEWDPQEPERKGILAAIVHHSLFEAWSATVIMLNAIFTFFAMNWEINHINEAPTPFMKAAELAFLVAYTVELVLRILVHRSFFLLGKQAPWNLFDFFLVLVSLDSHLWHATGGSQNVTFLRLMRIMKMGKFLRVLRLMHFFRDLRLIMNSIVGSLMSLFWSIVAMALIFYMFGLVFVQGVTVYFTDNAGSVNEDHEAQLRDAFGSVQTSMMTLFMSASGGDDWSTFYNTLVPVGNAWVFVLYICFNHIALMNILTGIFVERAMKLAEPDREAMFFEKRRAELQQIGEITQLVQEMDTEGNGSISHEEFQKQMFAPGSKLRHYFHTLGLADDAEIFFKTVRAAKHGEDHHNGIEVEDFVRACMKLQGSATSLDMQVLSNHVVRLQRQVHELLHKQAKAGELLHKQAPHQGASAVFIRASTMPHRAATS